MVSLFGYRIHISGLREIKCSCENGEKLKLFLHVQCDNDFTIIPKDSFLLFVEKYT